MRAAATFMVTAACALSSVTPVAAQMDALPPAPSSAQVLLTSDALWRSRTLSDAPALRTQLSLGLLMRRVAGAQWTGLQAELDGWTPFRSGTDHIDQYTGTLRLVVHPGGGARPNSSITALYRALYRGHGLAGEVMHELGGSAAYELHYPARGVQAIVAHADLAHAFGRASGTFARLGLSAALPVPTVQWLDFNVATAVSFSDYAVSVPERAFGYHATELQIGARMPGVLRFVFTGRLSVVPVVSLGWTRVEAELGEDQFAAAAGVKLGF